MTRLRALESLSPLDLERKIKASPKASRSILAYLEARSIPHSGIVSGSTLAAACGQSDGRIWRRWIAGDRAMPLAAKRALICAAGWCGCCRDKST